MNQLDVKQVIQDRFFQYYRACYLSIAGNDNATDEVRRYAVNLWDVRNEDEVERDKKHGVTCMMYIQWCVQKWREITQSPTYENEVMAKGIADVAVNVRIWAAIDFKENAEVYNGPDSGFHIEEFARHQWLKRSPEQVERDKQLGIVQDDYVTWCAQEFRKISVRMC